jgi:hypothetical protein
MSDVTHILNAIESGNAKAAEQLLPLVYDELRKLAAAKMAGEAAGHTLDATALVHESYLRLVPGDGHALVGVRPPLALRRTPERKKSPDRMRVSGRFICICR